MKFKEIELKLPEIIYDVEEKVRKSLGKGPIFTISGGCISDHYMGKKFRDIDVFTNMNFEEDDIEKMKKEFGKGSEFEVNYDTADYNKLEEAYLIKIKYKGHEIEIIPTSLTRVTEFDTRFREFHYYNGKVYASEGALEDIKNKKIVVTNHKTPLSTFFRIHRFREKMGFEFDDETLQYVKWAFDKEHIRASYAFNYIESRKHKISEELYHYLIQEIENNIYSSSKNIFGEDKNIDGHEEYRKDYKQNIDYRMFLNENEDNRKLEYAEIKFKDAKFPFNKDLEESFEYMSRVGREIISVHYDQIEEYKKFEKKELEIQIPFEKYQKKLNFYYEILKKHRLVIMLETKLSYDENPFSEKEEVKGMKKMLDKKARSELMDITRKRDRIKSEFTETEMLKFEGIKIIPKELKVIIAEAPIQSCEFGDYLKNNVLRVDVLNKENDKLLLSYRLRKCDNGKYAVAGVENPIPDGSGFYLEEIFDEIKKQMPEFINFKEKEEYKGLAAYSYQIKDYEHYFNKNPKDACFFLEVNETDLKMELQNLEIISEKEKTVV